MTSGRSSRAPSDVSDPLVRAKNARATTMRYVLSALGAFVLHGIVAALFAFAGLVSPPSTKKDDEPVDVEIVSTSEPEPEEPTPEPEEPSEPEPAPEPEPKKEKPEEPPPERPEPEPPKEPEPEDEPPEPEREDPEESSDPESESMEPVELEGLSMESTVEGGEGPTMKAGKGIEKGRVTDRYVDPDRMDDVETGGGDGDGRGGSDSPGERAGRGEQEEREAKVVSRERVAPKDYPVEARRRGIEGEVIGLLTVDAEGKVVDVEIKQSLGHGLDELAAEAFRKWRFEPARENGRAVSSKVRVTHQFDLQR